MFFFKEIYKCIWSHALTFVVCGIGALFMYKLSLRYRLYANIYAWGISKIAGHLDKSGSVMRIKRELFDNMVSGKRVIEIGAGSGPNLPFYPAECEVQCVEPKLEFKRFFVDNVNAKGKHLKAVDFVEGVAERLSSVIEPNTADYVVCTLVLCSVGDLELVAEEVKKVLKPVGIINNCYHQLFVVYRN